LFPLGEELGICICHPEKQLVRCSGKRWFDVAYGVAEYLFSQGMQKE